LNILESLGLIVQKNNLIIPFYRRDLNFKADIAEELARIK
jgi:phenylalanyl-tRNA synthetase beta subunit